MTLADDLIAELRYQITGTDRLMEACRRTPEGLAALEGRVRVMVAIYTKMLSRFRNYGPSLWEDIDTLVDLLTILHAQVDTVCRWRDEEPLSAAEESDYTAPARGWS